MIRNKKINEYTVGFYAIMLVIILAMIISFCTTKAEEEFDRCDIDSWYSPVRSIEEWLNFNGLLYDHEYYVFGLNSVANYIQIEFYCNDCAIEIYTADIGSNEIDMFRIPIGSDHAMFTIYNTCYMICVHAEQEAERIDYYIGSEGSGHLCTYEEIKDIFEELMLYYYSEVIHEERGNYVEFA